MRRLWFVVPVHCRLRLTAVCLKLLLETCRAMREYELEANAVVIGEDESVDLAAELGFATVRRNNKLVGRKFNDGYQLACDPDMNPEPADYVVPCGSDDWLDPVIFRRLPEGGRIGIFRRLAHVDEKRERMAMIRAPYLGGCGIRVFPREKIVAAGYRPCEEDRQSAMDSSTLTGIRKANGGKLPELEELDVHPLQIVDWKSPGVQLHAYKEVAPWRKRVDEVEPFSTLEGHYPDWALEEMRNLP